MSLEQSAELMFPYRSPPSIKSESLENIPSISPCLLCGSPKTICQTNTTSKEMDTWTRSTASSLCQLLSVKGSQFQSVFFNGSYCQKCFVMCADIDFSLKQMSVLEGRIQSLRETVTSLIGTYYGSLIGTHCVGQESSSILLELAKELNESATEQIRRYPVSNKSEDKRVRLEYQVNNFAHMESDSDSSQEGHEDQLNCKIDPDYTCDEASNSEYELDKHQNIECVVNNNNTVSSNPGSQRKVNKTRVDGMHSSNGSELRCSVSDCQGRFTTAMKLKLHIRTVHEHDPAPYHCEYPHCTRRFTNASEWFSHYDEHKDSRGYFCCIIEGCDKFFKKRRNLTQHLDTRHIPRPRRPRDPLDDPTNRQQRLRCEICSLTFPQDAVMEIEEHETLHLSNPPLSCVISSCCDTFANLSELKLHVGLAHEEIKFICPSCPDKVFRNEILLNFHIRRVCERKRQDPNVYKCEFPNCNRILASAKNLKDHMALHSDKRDYVCEECGASYKQKKGLVRHKVRTHLKETPYACLYCTKAFPTATQLRVHEETHRTEKNLLCSGCGKAFNTRANLKQHVTFYCPQRRDHSRKPAKSKRNAAAHERNEGKESTVFSMLSDSLRTEPTFE